MSSLLMYPKCVFLVQREECAQSHPQSSNIIKISIDSKPQWPLLWQPGLQTCLRCATHVSEGLIDNQLQLDYFTNLLLIFFKWFLVSSQELNVNMQQKIHFFRFIRISKIQNYEVLLTC